MSYKDDVLNVFPETNRAALEAQARQQQEIKRLTFSLSELQKAVIAMDSPVRARQ